MLKYDVHGNQKLFKYMQLKRLQQLIQISNNMTHYCVYSQLCSNFHAGNIVRSNTKNAKLDIRDVFGSVCRHEFLVIFMNMSYGER